MFQSVLDYISNNILDLSDAQLVCTAQRQQVVKAVWAGIF